MIQIIDAIRALVPNAECTFGDTKIGRWHDSRPQPTQEEIDAKIAELQAQYDANQYQRDRAEAYPSWQDQLDTIYHQGIDAWKAGIQAIKNQHPKP